MLKKIVGLTLIAGMTLLFGMSVKALNTASKKELVQIKGIGDKKADAIIKARKKSKFTSFADVEKVKGVGPVIIENIKKDVKVKESKSKRG